MASTLQWDTAGTHLFETGVDRVVLYSTDGVGVPWNGVKSITESVEGADYTPLYLDGMKFQESRLYGDFTATLEAFSAPPEFSAHDGTPFNLQGLGFGLQPKKKFGLVYRTLVGNDIDREEHGYKLHLVYNATATASDSTYTTIGDSVEPSTFSWDISTIPQRVTGIRPTAHLVIDSTRIDSALLGIIEGYLYGTNGIIPQLPSIQEIVDLCSEWVSLGIVGPIDYQGKFSDEAETLINLATNPSFEATSGTVEVRRNHALNPNFETNAASVGNVNAGSSPVIERSTVRAHSGGASLRFVYGGGATAADAGPSFAHSLGTLAVGDIVTVSAWIYQPILIGGGLRFFMYGGPFTGGTIRGGATTVVGDWVRISITGTAATAAVASIGIGNVTGNPAGEFWVDDLLIEKSSTLNSYFDGATQPKLRRNLARFPRPTAANQGGLRTTRVFDLDGFDPAAPERVTMSVSEVGFFPRMESQAGGRTAVTPGVTYTFSATLEIDGIYSISMQWLDSAAVGLSYGRLNGTGVRGQRVFVTGVAPALATQFVPQVGFPDNTPLGVQQGYSALMVEEGSTSGTYFDGATGALQGFGTAWEGTANASPSYMYDVDLTPAWTGTANASASVLTGKNLVSTAGNTSGLRIASTQWSNRGGQSLRVIPVAANPAAYVSPGLAEGVKWTALATVRIDKDIPEGNSPPRLRQEGTSGASMSSPRQAGSYTLRITGSPTGIYRALYMDSLTAGQDIWWDDILVIEGEYSGDYFDGNATTAVYKGQRLKGTWLGTANGSKSQALRYSNLPEVAADGAMRMIGSNLWARIDGVWENKGVIPQI